MLNMLKDFKVYSRLEAGHYKVLFGKYSMNQVLVKATGEVKENIQFPLTFPDGRKITYTVFPSNLKYVLTNIKIQLGTLEPQDALEVLEQVNGEELDVWITYNEYGMNINLHEPQNTVTETVKIDLKDIEV